MSNDLYFEHTIKMFLNVDERKFNVACEESNPEYRKRWLNKIVVSLKKDINELDTELSHKRCVLNLLCSLEDEIKRCECDESFWKVVYILFRICGQLTSWRVVKDDVVYHLSVPIFGRNLDQYNTAQLITGNDISNNKDIVSLKVAMIQKLKDDGVSTFDIALIFNISEYAVKKHLKEAKRKLD
jgi:predicted DNA binding protein